MAVSLASETSIPIYIFEPGLRPVEQSEQAINDDVEVCRLIRVKTVVTGEVVFPDNEKQKTMGRQILTLRWSVSEKKKKPELEKILQIEILDPEMFRCFLSNNQQSAYIMRSSPSSCRLESIMVNIGIKGIIVIIRLHFCHDISFPLPITR